MQEFLGALGLAWPRLLLYPGGLSALGLAWLLAQLAPRLGLPARSLWPGPSALLAVPPLLAISLMPLPYAVPFPYGLDMVVALALLNGPHWLRSHHPPPTTHHLTLILFVLAGLAMAQGAGGWRLDSLLGWATRPAPLDRALLLLGSLIWLIAALQSESPDPHGRDLGSLLRLIGHLLIAGMPWLGLFYAASTVW